MATGFTARQRDFLLKEVETVSKNKLTELQARKRDDEQLDYSLAARKAKQEFIRKNPKVVAASVKAYIADESKRYSSFEAREIEIPISDPTLALFLHERYGQHKARAGARERAYEERILLIKTTANNAKRSIMFDDVKAVEGILANLEKISTTI